MRSQGSVRSGAGEAKFLTIQSVLPRLFRVIIGSLTLFTVVSPSALLAQYTETKIGEYLNYALAATNGSVYAGYNSINYAGPVVYTSALGWTSLPISTGFNTSLPYYGYTTGISRDGTVISGYAWGTSTTGSSVQYALYWVNGVETIIAAPPDDPSANLMTATAVSGDGSTLFVEDTSGTNGSKVETYVYDIATRKFTSVGYLGSTVQQSYGTAFSYDGSVAIGYSNLDNTKSHGFIWTKKSGLKDMGVPHHKTYYVVPTCISDDGTVIFGRHTELNGWLGFRYTAGGFEEIGGLSPSGCTADGTEAFGIQDLYFPGIWTTTLGGGSLDELLTAHGIKSTLGDLSAPVTISPDGTILTAIGIFVYVGDQAWGGTYQIGIPSPLNTTPIPGAKVSFSTPYQTTLQVPAPGLVGYAEFNKGATAAVVSRPRKAATFVLKANGAFSYTPKAGFGGHNDTFTYHLINSFGTSVTGKVTIAVGTAP